MNLWESGIGVSGLVGGPFWACFWGHLVDDGVPLEMALGVGEGFGAGLELLILLFLESLQPVHLLFTIYLLMFLAFSIRLLYVVFIYFSFSRR